MADNDASPAVNVTVVGLTDVGRVREHNEDNFLVMNAAGGKSLTNGERAEWPVGKAVILAVADGMGGAAAGEVASQHAVDRFGSDLQAVEYADATPDQLIARIHQTLQAANDDILQDVEANPDRKGMGTTMTSAVVVGETAYISQVGDSRCYLLRKKSLLRLTRDQSLIEQLIDEGTITPEEAEKMGGHNIILQALGVEETVRPDTKKFDIRRGDVLLFCSDGLSGMIKDDVIERILVECGHDLVEGVQRLIQAANDNGGRDNITVILARFDGDGLREPMASTQQGDIDQAGVRFQAPPPPEVPNPMKKISIFGLAILAVLAVMILFAGRSDADLKLALEPAELDVALVLEDAQGQVVASLPAERGEAVFLGLELGTYTLKATAPNYWDFVTELKITEAAVNEEGVHLAPKPVALFEISSPHSFVDVVLTPQNAPQPLTGTVMKDKPLQLSDVPAGSVELRATREGFADFTKSLDLPPGSAREELRIDLVERKGTLVFAPADGLNVSVVDARGEPLGEGTTTSSGELRLPVRVGMRHEVRVEKAGFEPFSQQVDVTEGGESRVEVRLERLRATVRFRASARLDGEVERKTASGWEAVAERGGRVMGAAGTLTRPLRLEPGEYRISWEQDGARRSKEFKVEAPREGETLEVELDG